MIQGINADSFSTATEGGEAETESAKAASATLVDAHVHLHPSFEVTEFLRSSAANFEQAAARLGLPNGTAGCLLLTESFGTDRFAELRSRCGSCEGEWSYDSTMDESAIIARRIAARDTSIESDGKQQTTITVIAGRQIATQERLEVLALGTREVIGDGQSINSVIEQVLASGALCVLPWGFGKWTGRRGTLIRKILDSPLQEQLYLGDNAGRLNFAPSPPILKSYESKGVPILPGTDPFPFPDQVSVSGRYGFVLETSLGDKTPVKQLTTFLGDHRVQPRVYGRLETLGAFLRKQTLIHFSRRGLTEVCAS